MTKDRKGNVGIIVSANTGGGTPSASLSKYKSKTNAPTIYHQKGTSAQIGGSIDIGTSLGLEYVVFPDSTTNDVYQGTTISTGFGVSCIPAEIHGEIGYSWVYGFNIYDEMNNIYNRIMEW